MRYIPPAVRSVTGAVERPIPLLHNLRMGRMGAATAVLGFFLLLISGVMLLMSLLFGGNPTLPVLSGGAGAAMVAIGLVVAGLFSNPRQDGRGVVCPVCRASNPAGQELCANCRRPLPASSTSASVRSPDGEGRTVCGSCGTDSEPDADYCKACGAPLA